MQGRKTIGEMFCLLFRDNILENLTSLLVHLGLFGFGIFSIAIGRFDDKASLNSLTLIILIISLPVPTLFYILTVQLTIPLRAVRYRNR